MSIRIFVQATALLAIAACSSGTGIGDPCTSDSECTMFKCLHDQTTNTDNSCSNVPVPAEGACSPACRTHADCTQYGATFKCALSQTDVACNPTGICRDNYTITCTPGPCREAPAN